MVDIQQAHRLCRLCGTGKSLDSLTEIFPGSHSGLDLATCINQLLGIQVKKNDGLPKSLCQTCYHQLLKFHDFQASCQQTQTKLLKDHHYLKYSMHSENENVIVIEEKSDKASSHQTSGESHGQAYKPHGADMSSSTEKSEVVLTAATLESSKPILSNFSEKRTFNVSAQANCEYSEPHRKAVCSSISSLNMGAAQSIAGNRQKESVSLERRHTISSDSDCKSSIDCDVKSCLSGSNSAANTSHLNNVSPMSKVKNWLSHGFPSGTVVLAKPSSKLYILPDGCMYEVQDKPSANETSKQPSRKPALTNVPCMPFKRKRGRPPTRKETILKNLTAALKNYPGGVLQPLPSSAKTSSRALVSTNSVLKQHSVPMVSLKQPHESNSMSLKKMPIPQLPVYMPVKTDGRLLLPKLNLGEGGSPNLAYRCPKCHVYYLTRDLLIEHSHSHSELKSCLVCSLPFLTLGEILIHIREMHPKHICSHAGCNKFSANPETIKKHSLVHVNNLDFKCDTCGASFKSSSYLHRHYDRTHNPARPIYSCRFCGKSFKWKVSYKYHIHFHLNGNFSCPKCPKTFQTRDSLVRHEKALHGKYAAHMCRVCHKSFGDHHTLLAHWKRHFKKKYKVHQCHWPGCTFSDYTYSRVKEHILRVHQKLLSHRKHTLRRHRVACHRKSKLAGTNDFSSPVEGSTETGVGADCKNEHSILSPQTFTDVIQDQSQVQSPSHQGCHKANTQPVEVLKATIRKLQDRLQPSHHTYTDATLQTFEANSCDNVLNESDVPAEGEVVIVEQALNFSGTSCGDIDTIAENVVLDESEEIDSVLRNSMNFSNAACLSVMNHSTSSQHTTDESFEMIMHLPVDSTTNNLSSEDDDARRQAAAEVTQGVSEMGSADPQVQTPLIIVERCGNSATAMICTDSDVGTQGSVLAQLHYDS